MKKMLLLLTAFLFLSSQPYDLFTPDDYSVTKGMLEKFHSNISIKDIYSYDKAWFINKELNEILIFELYTDYHRLAIYHCTTDFLFSDLINLTKIHRKINPDTIVMADEISKMQSFQKLFSNAVEIDKSYFKTNQGISLGICKNDAIRKYGYPQKSTLLHGIEILNWDFMGEYVITETGEKPKGKIAKNSWGYHIVLYFKSDRLVALILKNDIP
jgi:hypothetical protein